MKKIIPVLLYILALLALTAPALAVEDGPPSWLFPDWPTIEEEPAEDTGDTSSQEPEPLPEPSIPEPEPEEPPPAEAPTPPSSKLESAGTPNETSSPASEPSSANVSLDAAPPDKYPVGSYIDPSGQVWSSSGSLLSPEAPETGPEDALSVYTPDVLADPADSNPLAVDTASTGTAYVMDLRPADSPPVVLSGLKALVTSIFGEYTPVTTNAVISQTIGDDTYQYLVETVAPGSAGVDYEWAAGVVLFAILLYCLMRLLGGVLK